MTSQIHHFTQKLKTINFVICFHIFCTVGLHPPITASHTQPAPMPLLNAKSLQSAKSRQCRRAPSSTRQLRPC